MQKTAYEMRISDWSSDVCSSDLPLSPVSLARLGRSRKTGPRKATALALAAIRETFEDSGLRLAAPAHGAKIGRASGEERVCQYVSISVVAVSLKKQELMTATQTHVNQTTQSLIISKKLPL